MKKVLLFLFLFASLGAQITDKNFKDKTGDGVSVVVFTSKWAESDGMDYVKGVKGHEDAIILQVMSEDVKKVCKKLRIKLIISITLNMNRK